jgi:serine/threonine protein kinase
MSCIKVGLQVAVQRGLERDMVAAKLEVHVASRVSTKSHAEALLADALAKLDSTDAVVAQSERIVELQRLASAVARARDEMHTQQTAIRHLCSRLSHEHNSTAFASAMESLPSMVVERNQLRQTYQCAQSNLTSATSEDELQTLVSFWGSQLDAVGQLPQPCAQTATAGSARHADAEESVTFVRSFANQAQEQVAESRSEFEQWFGLIRARYEAASATTDAAARSLSVVLGETVSGLQHALGSTAYQPEPSRGGCISEGQDAVLSAICAERHEWATVGDDLPFSERHLEAARARLQMLCESATEAIARVGVALETTRKEQRAWFALGVYSSEEARTEAEKLVPNHQELTELHIDFRHINLDLQNPFRRDIDNMRAKSERLRDKIRDKRAQLEADTDRMARLAYSHFPELLATSVEGSGGSERRFILMPAIQNSGLLRPCFDLDDFDEKPTLIPTNARHSVFKAKFCGTVVVVKEYKLAETNSSRHFTSEVRMLQRLKHPSIVELLAVFYTATGDAAFVQMPFYQGGSLAQWVIKETPRPQALHSIMFQVVLALVHVHSNAVIHGDVKPDNIFVEIVDGSPQARLGDFDLSQDAHGRSLSLSKLASSAVAGGGTPLYMAPELFVQPSRPATLASDIFSLGRTFCYAHFPTIFGDSSATEAALKSHGNEKLVELIRKLLAEDPTDRPKAGQVASMPLFAPLRNIGLGVATLPVPHYWDLPVGSETYAEYDVSDQMRERMQKMIDNSLRLANTLGEGRDAKNPWPRYNRLAVKSVMRIEDPSLWARYSALVKHVRRSCSHEGMRKLEPVCYADWMDGQALQAECNELYLFHGTSPDAAKIIKHEGFDHRFEPKSGRMLGDGVYFAENASKSDQYGVPGACGAHQSVCLARDNSDYCEHCGPCQACRRRFYFFVARVCVGAAYVTNKPGRFRRPPERSKGGPCFDSVLYDNSGSKKHREVLSSLRRTFFCGMLHCLPVS